MKDFFNNQRILDVIWKRKFHFIAIGVIAIILSAFFSSPKFITPKFKSTARIYPTNNVFSLSDESETEQMLEIVNSRDIKLQMFDAFNLPDVYKIKRDDPHFMTYMFDIYNTNVGASKTEFETVEIKVMDENPQRASDMCDSIIVFYNHKIGGMHALKYKEVATITNNFISKKQNELDSLGNELQKIREESQIISFKGQVEQVTEGYMNVLAANSSRTSDARLIKKQYEGLAKNGAKIFTMENKYEHLSSVIDSLSLVKDLALVEANKSITYCHVVEAPIPADKKSYPVRWLIVAFSLFSTLFAGLVFFLILDYKK